MKGGVKVEQASFFGRRARSGVGEVGGGVRRARGRRQERQERQESRERRGEIGGASGSLGGRNRRPGQCKPGSLPDDIVALDIAVILLFFPLFPHPPPRAGLVTPRVFLFAF